MPLVSIIIPIYNAEKYLRECLDSIINQTYKNIEIICIDSSTDNSPNIIKEFAKQDNRIKFYHEVLDVAEARNKGFELANGKYVTSIDADDYCSLDTIETSVMISEKTNCDILLNFVSNKDKKIENISYTTLWQMFIRKEFLDNHSDIKFVDGIKFGEDAVFTHKILCLTTKIEVNKKSKYFYRYYPEQTTSLMIKKSAELLNGSMLMLNNLESFYNERSLWETKNNHFLNFVVEQPFSFYIRNIFNKEQKTELFNFLHRIIREHNLKENFKRNNIKIFMFKKFLRCGNYNKFEIYIKIMSFLIKINNIYRKIKSKNLGNNTKIVKF